MTRRLLRSLSFLPLAFIAACASGETQPSDSLVYEDDPNAFAEGRADGNVLIAEHEIEGYVAASEDRVVTSPMTGSTFDLDSLVPEGTRLRVIRRFEIDGEAAGLFVNVDTQATAYALASALEESTRLAEVGEFTDAPYLTNLEAMRGDAYDRLPSAALDATGTETRLALTIDMCQSTRAWDIDLYEWLVALADERGEAIPVGVAMTGLWAGRHGNQYEQLKTWHREGKLAITWVNHSYHHPVSQRGSQYLFMNASGVDVRAEVLDLEKLLLVTGQMVSPLFRFPGLTYNASTLGTVNDLGMFALDANAWIAKGQDPVDGSVILVHGNGNERVGITGFFREIAPFEAGLRAGTVRFVAPTEVLATSN